MKAALLVSSFLLAACLLQALPTEITYTEGDASVRLKTGRSHDAAIGDVLNTGDSLKTGGDGQAELDQKGVTLKISPNTVFTLLERYQSGSTSSDSVISVALGSVKLHYDKLTGKEPLVRTGGATAGARGTDFSVFAGADGSSLIVVDSGEVTVQAAGGSVDLSPNEGVEVPLGQPPGQKITVHSDQVDYRTWNDGKLASMLADPAAAMGTIETAMAGYIASVKDYAAQFEESNQKLLTEQQKRRDIFSKQGQDAATKYQNDVVNPLALNTGYLFLNVRYYSLAALSLRRYVGGRLYVFLKSRYITNLADPVWTGFLDRYHAVLGSFEESIVPHLVEGDI